MNLLYIVGMYFIISFAWMIYEMCAAPLQEEEDKWKK